MQISLKDTLQYTGLERRFLVDIDVTVINIGVSEYTVLEAPPFEIFVTNLNGADFDIKGEFYIKLMLNCDRCMTEVPYEMTIAFEKAVNLDLARGSSELDIEEINCIHGQILDVDELVYGEIIMNFPMKVLCKEDCKGICAKCGINKNNAECECDTVVLDPRMAKFLDIFNKSKEV